MDLAAYSEADAKPGTKLIVADVMEAELPEAHFDAVFVSNFLEHLPTPGAVYAFPGQDARLPAGWRARSL